MVPYKLYTNLYIYIYILLYKLYKQKGPWKIPVSKQVDPLI